LGEGGFADGGASETMSGHGPNRTQDAGRNALAAIAERNKQFWRGRTF